MGADATSVPARTDSSLLDWLRRPVSSLRRRAARLGQPSALAGYEPFLRRLIPLLIILFLAVLALARLVALMEYRESVEREATNNLGMGVSLVRAEDAVLADRLADGDIRAHVLLTSALPKPLKAAGVLAFVSNREGRIVAATPGSDDKIGQEIGSVLDGVQPLLVFGERAGVMETQVGGEDALAAAAVLTEPLGAMIVVHREREIYGGWRSAISVNVTLYAMTSIVLLSVLIAYFRQSTRASAADALFLETHHRVDTALSRGRCGLWDWDLARGRMYWSRSMYEILGMPSREGILPFSEVARLLHPDDGSFFEIARLIASGRVSNIERSFRMRRSDGQYIWLRARAEVVRNSDKDIHLIGVAVDVSENHALARLTDEANKRLQNAVENISETFVLWDSDNQLVLCNSKYQEVFGLHEADVRVGAQFEAVRAASRRPIEERKLTSPSFVAGERASEMLLADGRWLQVSERTMDDGSYVSIGTDVTPLKVHQERLSDSERRLMATINDLSAARRDAEAKARQLSELNGSYIAEKERAESANRAKTTFLANMSHELRTPLNAIIGFSEIMREGSFGPLGNRKYVEYASDIHGSGHYLLKLINDILDMSKIEAGRMVLSPEAIDVPEIVAEATKIVEVAGRAKSLVLEADVPARLSLVADRRATKQILLNLIANAVKFSDPGGAVRVRVKRAGGRAIFTIVDYGIGIPAEALGNLGRPFEQVENELTRTNKGTGLGLAIARSLIELQGGAMRIASRVGEGTIVCFWMPIQPEQMAPVELEIARAA